MNNTSLSVKSLLLVTGQFAFAGFLLVSHRWHPFDQWLKIPATAGGILAIWAIVVMRKSRLNIMPDLLPGSRLITSGPYRLIRHPMYTSLIIIFVPLVIADHSPARLLTLFLLIAVLVTKLRREEKQLAKTFPEYNEYCTTSYRLIPFLF